MRKPCKMKFLMVLFSIIMLCGCNTKEGNDINVIIESTPSIEQHLETQNPEQQNLDLNKQNEISNIELVCLKMKERGITKISRNENASSDLFETLWNGIAGHWYAIDYINRIKNRDVFSNYYEELQLSLNEDIYQLDYCDVLDGEGYYVDAFHLDTEGKSFDIIGNYLFSPDSSMVLGKLRFGDKDESKIIMQDKSFTLLSTDIREFINSELLLGDWYDADGICYSFGSDYTISYNDKVVSYEPFDYYLDIDFNFIEILDSSKEKVEKIYGYTLHDNSLSIYETEKDADDNTILCSKPILVLTK